MPMFPTEGLVRALTKATSKVTEAKEIIDKSVSTPGASQDELSRKPKLPARAKLAESSRPFSSALPTCRLQNITGTLSILKQWEDGYAKKEARNNFAMARIVYGLDPKPQWMSEKKKDAGANAMAKAVSAVDNAMAKTWKKISDQTKPKTTTDRSKPKKKKSVLVESKKVEKKREKGTENKKSEQGEQKKVEKKSDSGAGNDNMEPEGDLKA